MSSESGHYSAMQRRLHWIVAGLVLLQLAMQNAMRDAFHMLEQTGTLDAIGFLVTTLHTWGGAAIGLLVVYRLQLRRRTPVAPGGGQLGKIQALLASTLHMLMYMLLLAMVATGACHYYIGWPWAGRWHELGKWALIGLFSIHLLAALWHHFYKKDSVLLRMLGKRQHTDTMGD